MNAVTAEAADVTGNIRAAQSLATTAGRSWAAPSLKGKTTMAEELKAARGRLEAALAEAIASWGGIPRDHTNVLVKFDDLRLLLRTPPSMRDEGWQDIATAPKDGKPLLGFSRIGDHNVTRVLSWDEEDEAWICSGSGSPYDPTHWRPLPAPPTAKGER
jgi:hypothetical protein